MMRGSYWWWDDAVDTANRLAQANGRRFRVHRVPSLWFGSLWAVSEVSA